MSAHCFEQVETLKRLRRNRQRNKQNKNCCNYNPRDFRPQGSTPAIGVNTTKTPAQNNCDQNWQV